MAIIELEEEFVPDEERLAVASAMTRYGGSFIHAIGEALWRADPQNTVRLKDCFHKEWEHYKKIYYEEVEKNGKKEGNSGGRV